MAMIDDLRNLVHDNPVNGVTHFSNTQLDTFLDISLIDVNIWAETSYVNIAALETARTSSPSAIDQKVYLCTLLYTQIMALEADGSAFAQFVKSVTQDTTIDPGDAGTRLDKIIKQLKQQFEKRIEQWWGVMDGGLIWSSAGVTEF